MIGKTLVNKKNWKHARSENTGRPRALIDHPSSVTKINNDAAPHPWSTSDDVRRIEPRGLTRPRNTRRFDRRMGPLRPSEKRSHPGSMHLRSWREPNLTFLLRNQAQHCNAYCIAVRTPKWYGGPADKKNKNNCVKNRH